jgi:hypothetical protein
MCKSSRLIHISADWRAMPFRVSVLRDRARIVKGGTVAVAQRCRRFTLAWGRHSRVIFSRANPRQDWRPPANFAGPQRVHRTNAAIHC